MLIVPHLILKNCDKILLLRRSNDHRIWPGKWHCVTGTIEQGESPQQAIMREAKEEIGIEIQPPQLVTTIFLTENDLFNAQKQFFALELFFLSKFAHDSQPINNEPHKHDDMDWFDMNNLPEPIIPGVEFGLKAFFKGKNYDEINLFSIIK